MARKKGFVGKALFEIAIEIEIVIELDFVGKYYKSR